mgnify:CR=1 FL=1
MTAPHFPFLSRLRWLPLALASACVLAACGGAGKAPADAASAGKESAERSAVTVETAAAALRPISASYQATAALEAPNEAQAVSKTSGVLLRLLVEEGDAVK